MLRHSHGGDPSSVDSEVSLATGSMKGGGLDLKGLQGIFHGDRVQGAGQRWKEVKESSVAQIWSHLMWEDGDIWDTQTLSYQTGATIME